MRAALAMRAPGRCDRLRQKERGNRGKENAVVAHQVLLPAGCPYLLRFATLSIGASLAAVNAQIVVRRVRISTDCLRSDASRCQNAVGAALPYLLPRCRDPPSWFVFEVCTPWPAADRPTATPYSGQIRAGARKTLAWTTSRRDAYTVRSARRRARDGNDRLHPN